MRWSRPIAAIAPDRLLFTDDRADNIAAAARAGLAGASV
jgi:FMN phosphatase YigB (HAD superfamily)